MIWIWVNGRNLKPCFMNKSICGKRILENINTSLEGLRTTQGAVGVGRATRQAVVACFLAVLVVGYMVTRMFYTL